MSIMIEDLETGELSYVVCPYCGRKGGVEITEVDYEEDKVYYDCRYCDPDQLFSLDEAELEDADDGEYDEDYEDEF